MNPLLIKYFANKDPAIAERYAKMAEDNTELEAAQGDQKKAKMVGLFGNALSTLATARGRASGYNGDSSGFWNDVSKHHDEDVANAAKKKQAGLDNLLMGDKLNWQGVERERQGQEWGNADSDRARKGVLEGRDDAEYNRNQSMQKAEDDPKSPQSEILRRSAQKMRPNDNFDGMSATQIRGVFAPIEKMYAVDENNKARVESSRQWAQAQEANRQDRAAARADAREARSEDREIRRQEKLEAAAKKPLTVEQSNSLLYAERMDQAEKDFEDVGNSGFDRSSMKTAAKEALLPEAFEGEESKLNRTAERNFLTAVLRRESGASIAPSEFDTAEKIYFPRAGDTPKVIEQKRRNRQVARENIRAAAGPNAKQSSVSSPNNSAPQVLSKGQIPEAD